MNEARSTRAETGPDASRRGRDRRLQPLRTCVATRKEAPQDELLRFVVDPQGRLVFDAGGRLPGRGVYLEPSRQILAEAIKKGLFSRALKRQIEVPADLIEIVDARLHGTAKQAFSLARKAGLVATGFQKVEAELAGGRVAVLVHASDGRPDGIGKLDRKFRATQAEKGRPAFIFTAFSSDDLSLAIGGENVIHAAMAAGGQTWTFVRCAERLQRFRMTGDKV